MKRKVKWLFMGLVLVLLFSLIGVLPAGAQQQGTISRDKQFVKFDDVITVTVNDPDLPGTAGDEIADRVKVTSTSDPVGFFITITGTGAAGQYTGQFTVVDRAKTESVPAEGKLAAVDGDTITMVYYDKETGINPSITSTVDATAPSISNTSPADGLNTRVAAHTFAADIIDRGSKVNPASIELWIGTNKFTTTTALALTTSDIKEDTTVIGVRISLALGLSEGTQEWYIVAADNAGNTVRSDADLTTACDVATGAGCEKFTITVDTTAPELQKAATGWKYDTTEKKVVKDSKGVMLEYVEVGALDPASVTVEAFTVDGVKPAAIQYVGAVNGVQKVFLTMPEAISADATPSVSQTGGIIKDKAGNAAGSKTVTAADNIPPTFTVTVTGEASSVPITKKKVTIRVEADEALVTPGIPSVTVAKVKDDGAGNIVEDAATLKNVPMAFVTGLTNTWEGSVDVTGDGVWNVRVSGKDKSIAQNEGKKGEGFAGAAIDAGKAIFFEVDTALNGGNDPGFVLSPATKANETASTSPFIRINFDDEATEYVVLDAKDTHASVELLSATLDGAAIDATRVDDNSFVVFATDLALGTHKLVVTAKDEVGNNTKLGAATTPEEFTFEFEVITRPKYEVPLVPGMNLISLPGDPADTSIDAVFGALPVDLVVTYDPFHPAGPWLVAEKGADGKFTGTLETIDASHAYWVRSTGFTPISVDIPVRTYQQLPPAIPVAKGWNLVPVVDPALNAAGTDLKAVAGYGAGADDYFASISWTIGYTYDTQTNSWIRLRKGAADSIIVGKGYWVYVTTAGELVP